MFSGIKDPGQQWDYIISNPPYIPSHEIGELEPEVRDHDPKLALDGGQDGLDIYRILAHQAGRWTTQRGFIFLECGKDQAQAIQMLFKSASWFADQVVRDYNDVERILAAVSNPSGWRPDGSNLNSLLAEVSEERLTERWRVVLEEIEALQIRRAIGLEAGQGLISPSYRKLRWSQRANSLRAKVVDRLPGWPAT